MTMQKAVVFAALLIVSGSFNPSEYSAGELVVGRVIDLLAYAAEIKHDKGVSRRQKLMRPPWRARLAQFV